MQEQSTVGKFHWQHGWFFSRQADGSVLIEKKQPDTPFDKQPFLPLAVIPPNEWASIVAAVCAKGDTGETFSYASNLHDYGRPSTPTAI